MSRGERLFSFAVITDSHIKPGGTDESSPYRVNQLSNDRARYLVKLLNAANAEFAVHLGDFVHPVPILPTYDEAVRITKEIFAGLRCELFPVPGNHDVGDKALSWMPGPKVTAENIRIYESYFGKSYYSFDRGDLHFVVTNSSLWNSGLAMEAEQWQWLERDLQQHEGKRIFLFTHYPLFVHDEAEEEHYDNVGEPARSKLISLVKRYRVEAIYAGHVHHYFYNLSDSAKYYIVPSTSFLRPDYTEMFQVEPAPESEGGRDDRSKFGFFVVDVYEEGHVNRFIPTDGKTAAGGSSPADNAMEQVPFDRYRRPGKLFRQVGVYVRHSWAKSLTLPYGNVDEFTRKPARNDYYLLTLERLGIRKLRIPARDCLDPATRARMQALAAIGQSFTVFSVGLPSRDLIEAIQARHQEIGEWEWILDSAELEAALTLLGKIKTDYPVNILFSVIETSADQERSGSRFNHFVRHGFRPNHSEALQEKMKALHKNNRPDGFIFRLDPADDAYRTITALKQAWQGSDCQISLHVQMQGSDDPSYRHEDDAAIAARLAVIVAAAGSSGGRLQLFLDTFMDHDRGYYIRHGLIDRQGSPRPAVQVLRNLALFVEQTLEEQEREDYTIEPWPSGTSRRGYMIQAGGRKAILLPPAGRIEAEDELPFPQDQAERRNLLTGEQEPLDAKAEMPTIVFSIRG